MIEIAHRVAYIYLWAAALFILFCLGVFIWLAIKEANKPPDKAALYFQRQRQQQEAHNKNLSAYELNKQMAALKGWENKEGLLSPLKTLLVFVIVGLFCWGLSYV
ncbi:MAG: hypothetical protein ACRDCE_15535 [Cetobacterium sp.]|uniref:hypothetical protein n=1 Tax=Cetobacterium sp. TaxID=2071632 RepID=UPI003EE7EBE5